MSEAASSKPMFRTLLFASDFSETAREAFPLACSLARGESTRLIVLHVQEPVPFGELDVPVYEPGANETETDVEILQDQLRAIYAPCSPLPVEYLVKPGKAAETILQTAEEKHCDLIVLGTHGRSGVGRLLMGSVAEAVLRRSRHACMTVRSRRFAEGEAASLSGPIRTILHPTDFSRSSEAALGVARSIARDHGARLLIVHAVMPEVVPATVSEAWTDQEIGREALEEIRSQVEGPDLKHPVETQLRRGEAAREIVEAAEEGTCDLIVMGSHGRTGLARLVTGSVAEEVLRQASCPVLTVKSPRVLHSENTTPAPTMLSS